jgi:8-oxo-dGTP diphosphatase
MSTDEKKYPKAGIGVLILRDGLVLLGKRHDDPIKASSELQGQGTWTMPGGKLDFGETLGVAVRREVFEETGIELRSFKVVSVTDDMKADKHFVTVGFFSDDFAGEPEVKEPDEIVEWRWFPLDQLPEPMYPSSVKLLKNYLAGEIYRN